VQRLTGELRIEQLQGLVQQLAPK
jgi:hypothetical protein